MCLCTYATPDVILHFEHAYACVPPELKAATEVYTPYMYYGALDCTWDAHWRLVSQGGHIELKDLGGLGCIVQLQVW